MSAEMNSWSSNIHQNHTTWLESKCRHFLDQVSLQIHRQRRRRRHDKRMRSCFLRQPSWCYFIETSKLKTASKIWGFLIVVSLLSLVVGVDSQGAATNDSQVASTSRSQETATSPSAKSDSDSTDRNFKQHTNFDAKVEDESMGSYAGLEGYIQGKMKNYQAGTLVLVNWQDVVIKLKSPTGKICRWTMENSDRKDEMQKFNDKEYESVNLVSKPVNARSFYRTIFCKNSAGDHVFHVVVRPFAVVDYPVQVYYGSEKTVNCSLVYMHRPHEGFDSKNHAPPFKFEWTGPKDCPKKNWDQDSCKRYPCGSGASCKLDGYPGLEVKSFESSSQLKIKNATEDLEGPWRCIVYNSFNIPSHPPANALKNLESYDVRQKGIVNIIAKDFWITILIPIAVCLVLGVILVLVILFCKSCTDNSAQ